MKKKRRERKKIQSMEKVGNSLDITDWTRTVVYGSAVHSVIFLLLLDLPIRSIVHG